MSAVGIASGLALALAPGVLVARRSVTGGWLGAAQAALVAIVALGQADFGVAAIELLEAVVACWLIPLLPTGAAATAWLPLRSTAPRLPAAMPGQPAEAPMPRAGLAVGGSIAIIALGVVIPGGGIALALLLSGIALFALRRGIAPLVLAALLMQQGITLAALSTPMAAPLRLLAACPIVPGLVVIVGWLPLLPPRSNVDAPAGAVPIRWAELAFSLVVLVIAAMLPWNVGLNGPGVRVDRLAAHLALLIAALSAAAALTARCQAASVLAAQRQAAPVPGARSVLLLGALTAVCATAPLLAWIGLVLATAAGIALALPSRAGANRRLRLGACGLGLVLLMLLPMGADLPPVGAAGDAAASAAVASTCLVVGAGALAWIAPELMVAGFGVLLRWHPAAPTGAGDVVLVAGGLVALGLAACGVLSQRTSGTRLRCATLGHAGIAVIAIGLGTQRGDFAGMLQITLLALTLAAFVAAPEPGPARSLALAGLAGVPPCGLFASLALTLAAVATHMAWLLVPLGAGLGIICVALLYREPVMRAGTADRFSAAWLPLAMSLWLGFAMPQPVAHWFALLGSGIR